MITIVDDAIARAIEKRDRHRRHRQQLRTPAERMEVCWRLQAISRALLMASPEGYAAFIKRNHKLRAIPHDNAGRW